MHSVNNELVKAGHDFAAAISNDTPIIEIAKIVARLATQLDVTTLALREKSREVTAYEATVMNLTAQVQGLAAENSALKEFGDKLNEMHNDLNGTGTGIQGGYEVACQQLGLEAAMEEFDAIETPATAAALAEIRAQGVKMFAPR